MVAAGDDRAIADVISVKPRAAPERALEPPLAALEFTRRDGSSRTQSANPVTVASTASWSWEISHESLIEAQDSASA